MLMMFDARCFMSTPRHAAIILFRHASRFTLMIIRFSTFNFYVNSLIELFSRHAHTLWLRHVESHAYRLFFLSTISRSPAIIAA